MKVWTVAVLSIVLTFTNARAESWPPPAIEQYVSANGVYRFTVTPVDMDRLLKEMEDGVDGKSSAASSKNKNDNVARGVFERRKQDGQWERVWARQLVNDIAPADAVVSDSGQYVVTYDNWGSRGWGSDVIVVYGRGGVLIRSARLSAFLPKRYIRALTLRTTSSIHWGTVAGIDEATAQAMIKLYVPDPIEFTRDPPIEMRMELATGKFLMPPQDVWAEAMKQAEAVIRADKRQKAERRAWLMNPLRAPSPDADLLDWDDYLREAVFRISDPLVTSVWSVALPAPGAARAEERRKHLCEYMKNAEEWPDEIAVAAPSSNEALAETLRVCVAALQPCGLAKSRVFVAAPKDFLKDAAAALAPSCSRTIFIDTAVEIPQRPERMPK